MLIDSFYGFSLSNSRDPRKRTQPAFSFQQPHSVVRPEDVDALLKKLGTLKNRQTHSARWLMQSRQASHGWMWRLNKLFVSLMTSKTRWWGTPPPPHLKARCDKSMNVNVACTWLILQKVGTSTPTCPRARTPPTGLSMAVQLERPAARLLPSLTWACSMSRTRTLRSSSCVGLSEVANSPPGSVTSPPKSPEQGYLQVEGFSDSDREVDSTNRLVGSNLSL